MIPTFRSLHVPGAPLVLPNAWDYASAAALVGAGFTAIGTTSLGVAAAHGLPDGHGLVRSETLALTRLLVRLPAMITVDIEAGFSADPDDVAALTAELAMTGAVGINLEDGRPDGTLADPAHQADLIAAAKSGAPALVLNARIDTFWLNHSTPQTEARADRYLAAGADGIFLPGITDAPRLRELMLVIDAPLNVLYLPAFLSLDHLATLGVARVSTGSLLFRAALATTVHTAQSIRTHHPITPTPFPYTEIQHLATQTPNL